MDTATLLLKDGTVFQGQSIGARGCCIGEVIFNTAMTGYQEILTDPSYASQIVTLTYVHIGNTGMNDEDCESAKIHAAGLVVRDASLTASNWRSQRSLQSDLIERGIVGIAGIDTRHLTHHIRNHGAQNAVLFSEDIDAKTARKALDDFAGLQGMDLAQVVTTQKEYDWKDGLWGDTQPPSMQQKYKVLAYDFGIKRNILRHLVAQGCDVTVVPAKTPAIEILKQRPDGVFLSNGPGDPEPCTYAIENIQALLEANVPLFGICLGHQLLGLACGAKTEKMKFGHHGANHPVVHLESQKVMITSQNHGFCIREEGLPDTLQVTHRSLFDHTLQGIAHRTKPAFGFQGHPEASPGPHDMNGLFQQFINQMQSCRKERT